MATSRTEGFSIGICTRIFLSVHEEPGIAREDLLKMLQVVQIMDANAIKPGMAEIPQETMMRVWMA